MKLPKEIITVTPLSKILAGILFILLPFVGFFLGMEYQKRARIYDQNLVTQLASPTPTPIEFDDSKLQIQEEEQGIALSNVSIKENNIPVFDATILKELENKRSSETGYIPLQQDNTWIDCRYKELGFSLRIPPEELCELIPEYEYEDSEKTNPNLIGLVTIYSRKQRFGRGSIIISSYKNADNQTLLQWIKSTTQIDDQKYLYISQFKLNNLRGIRAQMDGNWWQGMGPHTFIYFQTPTHIIEMFIYRNYTDLETILKTLIFL